MRSSDNPTCEDVDQGDELVPRLGAKIVYPAGRAVGAGLLLRASGDCSGGMVIRDAGRTPAGSRRNNESMTPSGAFLRAVVNTSNRCRYVPCVPCKDTISYRRHTPTKNTILHEGDR